MTAAPTDASPAAHPLVTPRQAEILDALCAAASSSNRDIARRLGISPHTLNNHLRAIYAALDARNRTHAAIIWWRLTQQSTGGAGEGRVDGHP